ncbi:hypothetical protein GCM10019016_044270 [Streptomyces prasinosporus]|uniref:Uncharacterized protein n=1 Tax=Streptomyces prasinosporus TaxID=68256 RepID=A0ABP6TSC5_9ACTN
MLAETITAIASAGGTAVIAAAGTDLWTSFRDRLAKLLGRGDAETEQTILRHLQRTAVELPAALEGSEAVRGQLEAAWAGQIASILRALPDDEREEVARRLQELTAEVALRSENDGYLAQAHNHGQAIGRDMNINSANGGYSAGQMFFGSTPENPPQPGQTPPA